MVEAGISVADLRKTWGSTVALDGVSLTAEPGAFTVLLGPSGCGKSTLLRVIAGLEPPSGGKVMIAGKDVTGLNPASRRISMVFQSYALFPHLTVRENIIFGLKARRVKKSIRESRLQDAAEITALTPYLTRKPAELSGGQRQRVALARAIVAENPICLMDEPLSNLDAKLRNEMRIEIRALQRRLGITVIYVTHDQTEAMSLADKIVLMRHGTVEQIATPQELFEQPETSFAAGFIGSPPMNLIAHASTAGEVVLIGIRPEHIRIADDAKRKARISSAEYFGADTIIGLDLEGQTIFARVAGHAPGDIGAIVGLDWLPDKCLLFDAKSGRRSKTVEANEIARVATEFLAMTSSLGNRGLAVAG